MRNMPTSLVGIAALVVTTAFLSPADARQVGGSVHVGGGCHVVSHAPAGTVVRVVARALAEAPSLASCGYQYSRWKATGSAYWRDLYNVCVSVADEPPVD
jgi:hypothetical protein